MHADCNHTNDGCAFSGDELTSEEVFAQEQAHLSKTHGKLAEMGRALAEKIERDRARAAEDKRKMSEELTLNLAADDDAMETYADIATLNRVIDAYNIADDINVKRLSDITLLLKQPYFAKVALRFREGEDPKELYIGNAGISDESCRRMVVDWRSPVAEVYYNQDNGPTSYEANGRTIHAELTLRRQFEIEQDRLLSCFDTTVAIQDSLLLSSLNKRRTAQMQAITATIQKEQNRVIRHEDVPVLLVNGIAGSGKTSVLLQRIAYLFYQHKGELDPSQVFLVTPNPVFRRYISNVLPDLGEENPEILTWQEFAEGLMPADRSHGSVEVSLEDLRRIDQGISGLALGQDDFRDLKYHGERILSAGQIRQVMDKYPKIAPGPHLIALMRDDLHDRLESRLSQMSGMARWQAEVESLDVQEQVRIFHETIAPQSGEEMRSFTLRYLRDRFAQAFEDVERDAWLRIDRIGMRVLGTEGLRPVEWLYLKIALTGMSNPDAKYVMVDEVQDYSTAQLAVLARYFRRAHFLLLGDEHQAIREGSATFSDIEKTFEEFLAPVETCRLMTSYRSTPEITALFAGLLDESEKMQVSSVQRPEVAPVVESFDDSDAWLSAVRDAVVKAKDEDGLIAVIVASNHAARQLARKLGSDAPVLIDGNGTLPEAGEFIMALPLAKGLEFDHVIIPDASEGEFPDDRVSRNRLYTSISRATRRITVLSKGPLTSMLGR